MLNSDEIEGKKEKRRKKLLASVTGEIVTNMRHEEEISYGKYFKRLSPEWKSSVCFKTSSTCSSQALKEQGLERTEECHYSASSLYVPP